jgi:hypothetical protein
VIGLEDSMRKILSVCQRELTVSFPVRWTTVRSRSLRGTAFNTTTGLDRRRVGSLP